MSNPGREALHAEHELLRARASRLKAAFGGASARGPELAEAVTALSDALFQHEASDVFRTLAGTKSGRFESEHLSLRSLARDLRTVWDDPQAYPFPHAARLALTLADAVGTHLESESDELLR